MTDGEPNERSSSADASQEAKIYVPSPTSGPLRQGEILSNVVQARLRLDTIGAERELVVDLPTHPYAVVLNQDCDLESDFRERGLSSSGSLPSILFCEMEPAEILKKKVPPGSQFWKWIRQNKNERYQVLQAINGNEDAQGQGIPSLGVDFRRFFTAPTDEIYKRLKSEIKRRAILVGPYAQHLTSRFCAFHSRVPLPVDHSN